MTFINAKVNHEVYETKNFTRLNQNNIIDKYNKEIRVRNLEIILLRQRIIKRHDLRLYPLKNMSEDGPQPWP